MAIPLPTMKFWRLPDVNVTAATITGVVSSLYTALNSSVDAYGTSLGSDKWTITLDPAGTPEYVYAAPGANYAGTVGMRLIWGGRSTIGTVSSMWIDTATASNLHFGVSLNPSTFLAWDNAKPFTNDPFSGYVRVTPTGANATATVIRVYMSAESILVKFIQAAGTQYVCYGGAIVEPLTNDTSVDAWSDNRLYGLASSNITTAFGVASAAPPATNSSSSGDPFFHSTVTANPHFGVFIPGTTTTGAGGLKLCDRTNSSPRATNVNYAKTLSGSVWGGPQFISVQSAHILGSLRGIYTLGSIQDGLEYVVSTVKKVHVISSNTGSAADAYGLRAA